MGFGPEMSIEQLTKLLAEEIEYLEDNSRWANWQNIDLIVRQSHFQV